MNGEKISSAAIKWRLRRKSSEVQIVACWLFNRAMRGCREVTAQVPPRSRFETITLPWPHLNVNFRTPYHPSTVGTCAGRRTIIELRAGGVTHDLGKETISGGCHFPCSELRGTLGEGSRPARGSLLVATGSSSEQ